MITCARMNNLPMIIRRGLSCAYDFHDNDNSLDARDVWLFNLLIEIERIGEGLLRTADSVEFERRAEENAARMRDCSESIFWILRTAKYELRKKYFYRTDDELL